MGDMILADGSGAEIRVLTDDYDIEIGKGSKNDIKITVPYMQWRGDIRDGCRVYIPGGEYGGRIGDIRPSTRAGEVAAYGLCGAAFSIESSSSRHAGRTTGRRPEISRKSSPRSYPSRMARFSGPEPS